MNCGKYLQNSWFTHKNAIKKSLKNIPPPYASASIDCQSIDRKRKRPLYSFDQELAFWGFQKDEAFVGVALWAWPLWAWYSSLCSLGPCPQRSRPQSHAHKDLAPLNLEPPEGQFLIDRCNYSLKSCLNPCGRGYKKWAWQLKGSDICPPPPGMHIYVLSFK